MNIETLHGNLHRILVPSPTLPPATTTNAWITARTGGLIVDPAAHTEHTQQELIAHLHSFEPSAVFLTHHHHDHIGAAQRVRDYFGVPIIAHKRTAELVPFDIDNEVTEGDHFHTGEDVWTAFHTPGHAPGHLCLLAESDRSLIAGDMVAGEGTILINPSEGSIREYILSLEKLKTLNPSRLLPAHGATLNDANAVLQDYIYHRRPRILQIWELLTETPQSTLQLAKQIYTELPVAYLGMAAIQVHCGLIFLQEDCAVQEIDSQKGWVRRQSDYSITT